MADAVQGGGAEHFVGREGIAPFAEVEVAGQDRGGTLVVADRLGALRGLASSWVWVVNSTSCPWRAAMWPMA